MERKDKKTLSSRILLAVTILILAGVAQLVFCVYLLDRYEAANRQVENNIGEAFRARTDQMFSHVSHKLRAMLYEGENLRRAVDVFAKKGAGTADVFAWVKAITAVQEDFRSVTDEYGAYMNFFFYDPLSGGMIELGSEEPSLRLPILGQLKQDIEAGEEAVLGRGRWFLYRGEYLCTVAKGKYGFAGCFIRISSLTEKVISLSDGTGVKISFYDKKRQMLYTEERKDGRVWGVAVTKKPQEEKGWQRFSYGDFYLHIRMTGRDYNVILVIQFLFLLGVVAYLIMVGGVLMYTRRNILSQVNFFYDNLLRFSDGMRVSEENGIVEFAEAGKVMNQLADEINRLKIKAYEEQLERKNVELDYAQLQIRPHFFINCLNVIFSLAQTGKIKEIQNIVIHVSRYLRFTFKKSIKPVPLQKELDFIDNYLKVVESMNGSACGLRLAVEPELAAFPVPPVLLQTFVENAVKYGADSNHSLYVDIQAKRVSLAGEPFVQIVICDSGQGMPEDYMQALNEERFEAEDESHQVGIRNAIWRMKMLYGEKANICFDNHEGGGARVRIHIPDNTEGQTKT